MVWWYHHTLPTTLTMHTRPSWILFMWTITTTSSMAIFSRTAAAFAGGRTNTAAPTALWPWSRALYSSSSSSDDINNTCNDTDTTTIIMHTITWETPGDQPPIVWQAHDGELLRTAALRRGLTSPHNGRANWINCRGLGTCGTCAVEVTTTNHSDNNNNHPSPKNWLPPPNTMERTRLSLPPGHGANNADRLRLACQVVVRGDLTVRKYAGFWGQHCREGAPNIVQPTVPTTPLGMAEFVLDRTSPATEKAKEDHGCEESK